MSRLWDYKLIDVTRWEFGKIHDTRRAMELSGWELDCVLQSECSLGEVEAGITPVRLKFKRRRSA